MIGDFTWTGWDYLGEAGIGRVADADGPRRRGSSPAPYPWLAAWCGDIDITGHRRPASYYREIVFGLRADPYLAVQRPERPAGSWCLDARGRGPTSVGSWSWAGAEGTPVTVEVYSDADEVELLLDGRSLGTAQAGEENRYRADVRGRVRARRADRGRPHRRPGDRPLHAACRRPARCGWPPPPTGTWSAPTTPTSPTSTSRSPTPRAPWSSAPTARSPSPSTGPGVLQGLGSAAPATEESYLDDVHTTFDGRALAVVRPTGAGPITVTATAPGCAPVTVHLEAR